MASKRSSSDPADHLLTFGPHKGMPLGMAPLDYVGELAGYMVINGMPTGHHEFEYLCRDIHFGRAPAGMEFCRGPTLKITKGIVADHVHTRELNNVEAKRIEGWVDMYVNHPADVGAARKFIESTYLAPLKNAADQPPAQ